MAREAKQLTMATTRKEIERLEEIEKKSFAARSRFKERSYLQAVCQETCSVVASARDLLGRDQVAHEEAVWTIEP
jgi:hypothetical protein